MDRETKQQLEEYLDDVNLCICKELIHRHPEYLETAKFDMCRDCLGYDNKCDGYYARKWKI